MSRTTRPRVIRRLVGLIVATALLMPIISVASVSAACVETWGSYTTVSKSKAVPQGTYIGTVNYKLARNTCNLAVVTKIRVAWATNKLVLTNSNPADAKQIDLEGALLKNCNDLFSGCLTSPGTVSYLQAIAKVHYGNGTYYRNFYPDMIIPYSSTAATWSYWIVQNETGYTRYVYQFMRGVIYNG
jgi:hypothetical protein